MSGTSSILLADAEAALRRAVLSVRGSNSLDEAFAGWSLHGTPDAPALEAVMRHCGAKKGLMQEHRDVAALGFGMACGVLDADQRRSFSEGLARLCGRNPSMLGTPIACSTDAPALLGLAVGSALIDETERDGLAAWVRLFIERSYASASVAGWHRALLHGVCQSLSLGVSLPCLPAHLADLRVALRMKGVFPDCPAPEDDEAATLELLKTDLAAVGPAHAALRLAALRSISRSACTASLDRPTIPQLVRLLRRVPNALAHWTWEEKPRTGRGEARQWHVENEYHVQNLLWCILSPLFPDLKPEDYTPKIGPYQPRADLGVPSLRVIVEAKFWRESVKAQKMIEEIAADSSIYFVAGSSYTALIPFIWDDARRTEEHESLINGMKQLPRVADAVVVARPGLMDDLTPSPGTS